MYQQKDDTNRPDGREDKRAETQTLENKSISPTSSWWAKDDIRNQNDLVQVIPDGLETKHVAG